MTSNRSYHSLGSFISPSGKVALTSPGKDHRISYTSLHHFVVEFNIPLSVPQGDIPTTTKRKPIVCIALPNGPVLAAVCFAVADKYIAAPINCDRGVGPEQFQADVLRAGAACILISRDDVSRLQLSGLSSWADARGIGVFVVDYGDEPNSHGCGILDTLTITELSTTASLSGLTDKLLLPQTEPNGPDDIAIILFTSGTSGTKKIVPITVHNIVVGVSFVVESWGLKEDDVCLNMMPLFHIGGLVRNIFSPLFSGGSVICCPAFDPGLFWDVMEQANAGPTWYYASPSMHQMILDQGDTRQEALIIARGRIRMVCNAAGGLLPALAYRIRDCFECVVLPSYGMTECMPISTPPARTYQLGDRPGTSGISAGPQIEIQSPDNRIVPVGTVGHICIRGEPVFSGYLTPTGELDTSAFTKDGWFDTGDLGYLDEDGYLFITGRSKEVINRGGELISPFEVEQAIVSAARTPGSPIYNRVSQALAFSVSHDVLQEVVGVVLATPLSSRRVDIRQLNKALMESLQKAKHPVMIVYMDDLPKRNNKVLRGGLSRRLKLPELTEQTRYCELHWDAICPPPDTELAVGIPSSVSRLDVPVLSAALQEFILPTAVEYVIVPKEESGTLDICVGPYLETPDSSAEEAFTISAEALIADFKERIPSTVDGLLVPSRYILLKQPIPLDEDGKPNKTKLEALIAAQTERRNFGTAANTIEGRVAAVFAAVLNCSSIDLPHDRDFLLIGGDSLKAGKLLSALRSTFGIHIPIELIFRSGSIVNIASYLETALLSSSTSSTATLLPQSNNHPPPKTTRTITRPKIHSSNILHSSSTKPLLLLLQLVPLAILYPLRRAAQWTLFLYALAFLTAHSPATARSAPGRLLNIVLAALAARLAISIATPLLGIAAKWTLVLGRFREGVYPMWGAYHTRWWLTQKIVTDICGMGIFEATNASQVWYYRLLGARIGSGVLLNGVRLGGEWDLVDVGEGVVFPGQGRVVVRPFAVESGPSMYLGRIKIGKRARIGPGTVLAPGTEVPEGVCLGANSSSWEVDDVVDDDGNGIGQGYEPYKAARPHWALDVFGTVPILVLAKVIKLIPWLLGLLGLVMSHPLDTATPVISIIYWFGGAERVLFHYLAVSLGAVFGPMFLFGVVMVVKFVFDRILGKARPGPVGDFSQVEKWRICLIKDLLPESAFHDLTSLFGQHYEMTSRIMRCLGAKVGKRVYWPGTGPAIGDYYLVDVGDDVVFGSRANLVTSDGIGSEKIVVRDRAMIADRVTLLPGVTVGQGTVLGSGAVTRRDGKYGAGGVYIGSKAGDAVCLVSGADNVVLTEKDPGKAQRAGINDGEEQTRDNADPEKATPQLTTKGDASPKPLPASTHPTPPPENTLSTPFGRAFYLHQAPYRVLGQIPITIYCVLIKVLSTVYWNTPFIASVQILTHLRPQSLSSSHLPNNELTFLGLTESALHPLLLFALFALSFAILATVQSLLALLFIIASKWAFLGRRQPGLYSWDISPYCQRWQLFLSIELLRRNCFRGMGILSLLTGTQWLVWYFRAMGAKIGKNCALFANGDPSLMFTEPDLVRMGDRAAVDDASLVGHVNTRGRFELNLVTVGEGCVLRSGSRLLSSGVMERGSCLMEHTIVMGGEVVEAGRTVQGWPCGGEIEVVQVDY